MFVKNFFTVAFVTILSTTATARDYISISGSSTVLPFATIVAERFGRGYKQKTPVVESGGSSVGRRASAMESVLNLQTLVMRLRE